MWFSHLDSYYPDLYEILATLVFINMSLLLLLSTILESSFFYVQYLY